MDKLSQLLDALPEIAFSAHHRLIKVAQQFR
jgi:hypothetical protein